MANPSLVNGGISHVRDVPFSFDGFVLLLRLCVRTKSFSRIDDNDLPNSARH